MDGENRRNKILDMLSESERPISGSEIAKELGVSRQIIVQDIALLRAVNKNILSTNKGYIINEPLKENEKYQETLRVKHTTGQIQDELNTIVDYGGKILDVVVEHDIYGQITVDLLISNRLDVEEFIEKIARNETQPLKELTGGVHFHTVQADSERIMERIKEKLREKEYLLEK